MLYLVLNREVEKLEDHLIYLSCKTIRKKVLGSCLEHNPSQVIHKKKNK